MNKGQGGMTQESNESTTTPRISRPDRCELPSGNGAKSNSVRGDTDQQKRAQRSAPLQKGIENEAIQTHTKSWP